jgi:thermostable 8-oxoguanine DNA glycosylase
VTAFEGGRIHELFIPEPSAFVLPGVPWGRFDTLFTPAFWRTQLWFAGLVKLGDDTVYEDTVHPNSSFVTPNFALGTTLAEELAACLLGGYGIPAEIGLAAFQRVRTEALLARPRTTREALQSQLHQALSAPLCVGGRSVNYRFAKQRSEYLAGALHALDELDLDPEYPRAFRNSLLRLPGIGYKTASWITRNHLASDQIAILDVHVLRAGRIAGYFPSSARVERDYLFLEQRFLEFAAALEVSAALLDAVMWDQMRNSSRAVRIAGHARDLSA